ncbi:MAG: sigma-70 family RNA polymerase sigma factor [Pseudomonadota bacterium]|nr:sigma-70 family RNA polymerase sigma factor [Pseudomonadota bacterium]
MTDSAKNANKADENAEDDSVLIAKVAKGDSVAFETLAAKYTNMLFSVAYRMFPQQSDAEDIVQEALIKVWNKADLWDETKGASVSTWMYRLTYNTCIDHKRRETKGHVELIDNITADDEQSARAKMEQDESQAMLHDAINDLPERQRAALVLCHFEGLSNAEAAKIMDTTVKGVEGLLVRARKALQDKLQPYKEVLVS